MAANYPATIALPARAWTRVTQPGGRVGLTRPYSACSSPAITLSLMSAAGAR